MHYFRLQNEWDKMQFTLVRLIVPFHSGEQQLTKQQLVALISLLPIFFPEFTKERQEAEHKT